MEIKKTGKSTFGYYLQETNNTFHGCTQQVSKFIEDKLPCTIRVDETTGEDKDLRISKVKILSESKGFDKPSFPASGSFKREQYTEETKLKQASVMISYAKDLAVADKIKVDEIGDYAIKFIRLQEELVKPQAEKSAEA